MQHVNLFSPCFLIIRSFLKYVTIIFYIIFIFFSLNCTSYLPNLQIHHLSNFPFPLFPFLSPLFLCLVIPPIQRYLAWKITLNRHLETRTRNSVSNVQTFSVKLIGTWEIRGEIISNIGSPLFSCNVAGAGSSR